MTRAEAITVLKTLLEDSECLDCYNGMDVPFDATDREALRMILQELEVRDARAQKRARINEILDDPG